MKFILINNVGKIPNVYKSDNINDLLQEFKYNFNYDLALLNQFGINDKNKIYNNYTIYQYVKTPKTNNKLIIDEFKFNEDTQTFTSIIDKKNVQNKEKIIKNAIEIIQPNNSNLHNDCEQISNTENNCDLFGIQFNKHEQCSNISVSENDYETDLDSYIDPTEQQTDLENIDQTYLKEIEEKIQEMKKIQEEKENKIKEYDEKHKKEKETLVDLICENNYKKNNEKFLKEKYENGKNKFEADKQCYRKIKEETNTSDLKLPKFFVLTFNILKEMEEEGNIEQDNSYDIFLEKYKQDYTDEYDDTYGIFST
jgi:hypothetical protein